MFSGKMRRIPLSSATLLVAVAIASVAALAQTAAPVQIAANTTAPIALKAIAEVAPSTSALQARIDAQQQEINKLTALVEKLQSTLSTPCERASVVAGLASASSPRLRARHHHPRLRP